MSCELRPRYMDLGNEIIVLEHILAPQISFGGQSEKLVERNDAFAVSTDDGNGGSQGYQHPRQIRRMHNIRRPPAKDRVVFIFSGRCKTFRASLLQTDCFFQAEVPT